MKNKYTRQGQSFLDHLMTAGVIAIGIIFLIVAIQARNNKGIFSKPAPTIAETSSATRCNNGICEENESCSTCPADCGSCEPECGNCSCESGETCSNCPIDCCGCGDGACNRLCGENYLNCPIDCRN